MILSYHLNPVRAGVIKKPEKYRWSSYLAYIGRVRKEEWLTCECILGHYSADEMKARIVYKAFIEKGLSFKGNLFDQMKAGFIVGSEGFVEGIKKRIKSKSNREIPESRVFMRIIKYEEVIALVEKRFGIGSEELLKPGGRKNLARNICFYLLRTKTDMKNEEISKYFG